MNDKERIHIDSDKSERQRHWDEIAEHVEHIVDKLNNPVDDGIKEGIIALSAFDINTVASCEGHLDGGVAGPWIDVEAKRPAELIARAKELLKDKDGNKEKLEELSKKTEGMNLEERKKLFVHLDDFYKDRNVPFHRRLIVNGMALGWSRLQNQGLDLQKIESDEVRKERLLEYQGEMKLFIEFLKDKYFQG